MSAFDIREAPPTAAASGLPLRSCPLDWQATWVVQCRAERPTTYLRFVPWERKAQNVCVILPDAAGLNSHRVWAVPET